MNTTDVLTTVFAVKGVSSLVGAFKKAEQAQERLDMAELRAQKARSLPASSLKRTQAESNLRLARTNLIDTELNNVKELSAVMAGLAYTIYKVVDAYKDYATMTMNVRDLTGATAQEAARATSLLKAVGVNDTQAIADLLHLSKSVFNGEGRAALSKLGVAASPYKSGTQLFGEVADALQKMPDGLRKSEIMAKIFGERGVEAMLPILRMSKDVREQIMGLADSMDESALQATQRLQEKTALLGATFLQGIVYPIAQQVLPMLSKLIDGATWVIDLFSKLDKATGGWLSTVLVVVTVLTTIALAVRTLVGVYKAFNAVLKVNATVQAFITALQGPKGWAQVAAAAAATGIVVGTGVFALNKLGQDDPKTGSVDKFGKAVDKFASVADRMVENWSNFNRGGIPNGLSGYDITELSRRAALGIIG